jgi:hypothetical protein
VVLTFVDHDSVQATLCYANADIAKREQADEAARFASGGTRRRAKPPRLLAWRVQTRDRARWRRRGAEHAR